MEADFDRYYRRDLGSLVWIEGWSGRKILRRVIALPDDSAFRLARTDGWTTERELLASIHDRVTVAAHGWRLEGKPKNWPRPGTNTPDEDEPAHLNDARDVQRIVRFFGRPRT